MNRKILLIEPNYKNKFPPVGLMKIATYFREVRHDDVRFFKGDIRQFMLDYLTEICVDKLKSIDCNVDWKKRAVSIKQYIKFGRREDLACIKVEDSDYAVLIHPWLDEYKKEYRTGKYKEENKFDYICLTTLFTFYWDITMDAIRDAKKIVKDWQHNLMVGGVLASIQPDEIYAETGIHPFVGTLHSYGDIDADNTCIIDELPLDYSILDEIEYVYPDNNAYFSYTTRGCFRGCPFCAVPVIEPEYIDRIPLKQRIDKTRELYGEQRNLLLMDNNVLHSKQLAEIIEDIRSCGFDKNTKFIESNQYEIAIKNLRCGRNDRAYIRKVYSLLQELNENKHFSEDARTAMRVMREHHGLLHIETCEKTEILATYSYFAPLFEKKYAGQQGRMRIVDFNQGVDARLFNDEVVTLLEQIPIRPLRIAFDDIKTKDEYLKAVELSINHGFKDFSNYLLYNFHDKPEDLYERLRINVDLCDKYQEQNVSIYSFPMKYHPIKGENSHDRDYIGRYWNRKYIRAIQAILNATKGKVGKGTSFFEKAFGKDVEEYMKLLIMPETFLLYRLFFEHIGYTQKWWEDMQALTPSEKEELMPLIYKNDFSNIEELTKNPKLLHILTYYKNYRNDVIDPTTTLYKLKQEYDNSHK